MVATVTLEGMVDQDLWYHYDLANDVLYLRRASDREVETVSEETPDGFLELRRLDNDVLAGLTIINWWKRFGKGTLPDSIKELGEHIEPWARRLAA